MSYALDFAPYLPLWLLWSAGAAALLLTLYGVIRRARGALARGLCFALLLLVLSNPLILREAREPLPDVAALIVDRSQSMGVGARKDQADKALAALRAKLKRESGLELREAEIVTRNGEDTGTEAFAALSAALGDVPPERVAGAVLVTDGRVHDAPPANRAALSAPLHVLVAGARGERDRRLSVVSAARYAIVGQPAVITVRVEDFGAENTNKGGASSATVRLRVDGADKGVRQVPLGRDTPIPVLVAHGGENVVEIEAAPGPSELTLENNRAVAAISGVRDRLRVMLVSGEPHAGERVWRNLLKADPSVDLVHFTILRPPDKQDATPIDELSLIAFPTRQLFDEKLSSFDLVIFDRYSERGILPLAYYENLARYVENGGALLVSAGPEYADAMSIYRTPLAAVLPAQPTGDVVQQGFRPQVTTSGLAHPVTRDLPGGGVSPQWGRWFRLIGAEKISGETVMSGPGAKPLLVLDHIGKGRVAELLSDQPWLWARGYEGGGPQAELLRRLAHWLMKEPELEEERLSASIAEGRITVERRSMGKSVAPVSMTLPSGRKTDFALVQAAPGIWRGVKPAEELGLYRLSDGKLTAVAAAGPLNPKEVADMRADDRILAAPAEATGGSVRWLSDGLPDLRRVARDGRSAGDGWIGLYANKASRVVSVDQEALLPPWLGVILLLGAMLFAWRWESR